jgi:hypothetical protein
VPEHEFHNGRPSPALSACLRNRLARAEEEMDHDVLGQSGKCRESRKDDEDPTQHRDKRRAVWLRLIRSIGGHRFSLGCGKTIDAETQEPAPEKMQLAQQRVKAASIFCATLILSISSALYKPCAIG